MGSSGASREISRGRRKALDQLDRSFEGPLRGLDIGKQFFSRLGSSEFQGTPLGQGLALQTALLDEAIMGLRGETNFKVGSLGTAASDQIGAQLAARGVEGPAAALSAAEKLTGFSEGIRAQRLGQAMSILGGTSAAGSVLPSAQSFLNVGAARSSQAADIEFQTGLQKAGIEGQESAAMGQLLGVGIAGGIGALTGGLGLLPGLAGGFGGALGGFGLGSGLLPVGMFGGGFSPFGNSGGVSRGPFGFTPQGFNLSRDPFMM